MGKIAFIFAGQGDQHPGMGRELTGKYLASDAVFSLCDRIRPGTSEQIFSGDEAGLAETKNTQPCLFAMELAAAAALAEQGVIPDAAAGFSLGEVTAAAFCGILDAETGFRLVCRRGELMQQAAEKKDTAMAAVLKLEAEQVKDLCSRFTDIYPVNYNCPGQVTVSGLSAEMPAFVAAVREAGGRAVPLKVKGGFHSPFMKEAAAAFAGELSRTEVHAGRIPLYSNLTAKPYDDRVRMLLSEQICNPVQWEKIIRCLIGEGIDTFVEIGPGRTLSNMMKKIDPAVKAVTVYEYLAEVQGC